jgi:hypothetical protein
MGPSLPSTEFLGSLLYLSCVDLLDLVCNPLVQLLLKSAMALLVSLNNFLGFYLSLLLAIQVVAAGLESLTLWHQRFFRVTL